MSDFYRFLFRSDCLIKAEPDLQRPDFLAAVERDFNLIDGVYSLKDGCVLSLLTVPAELSLEINSSGCVLNLLSFGKGKLRIRVTDGLVKFLDCRGELELNLQKSGAFLIRSGGFLKAFLQESELHQKEGFFSSFTMRSFASRFHLGFPSGSEGRGEISGHGNKIIIAPADKEDLNICATDGFSFFGKNCRYFISIDGAEQDISFAESVCDVEISVVSPDEIMDKTEELFNLFDRFEGAVEKEHQLMEKALSEPQTSSDSFSEIRQNKVAPTALKSLENKNVADNFLYERFRKGEISLEELEKLL